jgi:hypothetical protein
MALVIIRAEDVGQEIARRMALIRLVNGYETEIGVKVWRGRRKIPADEDIPVTLITEGDDNPGSKPNRTVQQVVANFVIDGFDACDPNNPNDKAHAMLRDMKKAIFHDGGQFNGKVREINYLGRDIGPRPDGAGFVQARIVIEVEFVESLADPEKRDV